MFRTMNEWRPSSMPSQTVTVFRALVYFPLIVILVLTNENTLCKFDYSIYLFIKLDFYSNATRFTD
jgi:hypothetical protein